MLGNAPSSHGVLEGAMGLPGLMSLIIPCVFGKATIFDFILVRVNFTCLFPPNTRLNHSCTIIFNYWKQMDEDDDASKNCSKAYP